MFTWKGDVKPAGKAAINILHVDNLKFSHIRSTFERNSRDFALKSKIIPLGIVSLWNKPEPEWQDYPCISSIVHVDTHHAGNNAGGFRR